MKNVKLRLDYFLSLGLKLVDGDVYTSPGFGKLNVGTDVHVGVANKSAASDYKRFIASFAPRKNTGAQPCGDDAPVCIKFEGSANTHSAIIPTGVRWSIESQDSDIGTWKPCIKSLIKMQIEHDRKLALTAECEKIAADALKQGDKRRIEFMSNHTGQLEIHAVTYQFETDKEICCIAEDDGIVLIVDKEEFVAWHDAVDEMEAAKKKQVSDVLNAVNHTEYLISRESVRLIQDAGMLAEITLPLKN